MFKKNRCVCFWVTIDEADRYDFQKLKMFTRDQDTPGISNPELAEISWKACSGPGKAGGSRGGGPNPKVGKQAEH